MSQSSGSLFLGVIMVRCSFIFAKEFIRVVCPSTVSRHSPSRFQRFWPSFQPVDMNSLLFIFLMDVISDLCPSSVLRHLPFRFQNFIVPLAVPPMNRFYSPSFFNSESIIICKLTGISLGFFKGILPR